VDGKAGNWCAGPRLTISCLIRRTDRAKIPPKENAKEDDLGTSWLSSIFLECCIPFVGSATILSVGERSNGLALIAEIISVRHVPSARAKSKPVAPL
jgi:hypothetical protein